MNSRDWIGMEKKLSLAAKTYLTVFALLLVTACGGTVGDAFDTPEEAVRAAFADQYGEEAALSVRVVDVRPWQNDRIVFFDATASADRGEWQYQARVSPVGDGWVQKISLGGTEKFPCDHAQGLRVSGQPYIVMGRACAPEVARIRVTWRASGDTSYEELLPDGRFMAIAASAEGVHPLVEALDEDGNVVAILASNR